MMHFPILCFTSPSHLGLRTAASFSVEAYLLACKPPLAMRVVDDGKVALKGTNARISCSYFHHDLITPATSLLKSLFPS